MKSFTRWSAILVMVTGVVALIFGIIFIPQASSAEKEIADSITPLALSEVDAKYDAVSTSQQQMRAAEEPGIQAGTAAPSAMYNYLTIQRTSLGLTRSNIGFASFLRTTGIIYIIVGLGLILAGVGLFRRSAGNST
jgi:hypothetical protein